jgi:hypothetical protein
MKTCSKCLQTKEDGCFSRRGAGGLQPKCKLCDSQYYKDNRDHKLAYAGARQKAKRKEINEYFKVWSSKNKEKRRASCRSWRLNNLDKHAAKEAKRRFAKLNQTPKWLTNDHLAEINGFYSLAQHFGFHVDHIVPLKGKNVSGLHVPWNLQVLPAELNLSKGARHG